ncbi:hypothetical protein D1007_29243 [Hordeum vulgare]|nr:hypothetical protein D1007_29243 [Hordeum vulgare]
MGRCRHHKRQGEATEVKAARKSALAKAGVASNHYTEADASLKELQDKHATRARQLQLREDDLKAREAKLAVHDSELEKMVVEQPTEHMRLEALQCGMAEAQEAHAKLDARAKEV